MFVRTVAGLSLSIRIGLLTAAVSAVMAFVLGLSAAVCGKFVDSVVQLLIDIVMGIPHMLLLILISFACGRGFWGVVWGIAVTHWASLARLIRGEVLQLKQSQYVKIAEKLGISVNSVRTLKQNAYKKLKGLLKEYFYFLFLLNFTSWS